MVLTPVALVAQQKAPVQVLAGAAIDTGEEWEGAFRLAATFGSYASDRFSCGHV